MSTFLAYDYNDDLVCAAVEHYTKTWCGEIDVDFYKNIMYCCYNDHTLEVLIVHDFLEKIYQDVLEDIPFKSDQHQESLDDRD